MNDKKKQALVPVEKGRLALRTWINGKVKGVNERSK
jgi:hypothetical protein